MPSSQARGYHLLFSNLSAWGAEVGRWSVGGWHESHSEKTLSRVREVGRTFLAAAFAESQPVPRSATANLPSTWDGTSKPGEGSSDKEAGSEAWSSWLPASLSLSIE